ncbi:amidohydrolase family protein [Daejeonella sp.]|uniref:metal-dependent hydrolase family protein n=1 Tax=Daejeonella sp. TaxID=2805397 RepID=UPI0027317C74|nr:amidohydrolase family protein [Daejeonella sp.]MDP2415726.1 amidohydrolase family protein [Daejeonella sp.]
MKHIAILLAIFLVFPAFAQQTYIQCGRLIDGKSNSVQTEMTIIVESNKIIDVRKGYQSGATSDMLINMRNQTVMPGFIDSHVHLSGETSKNQYMEEFTLNDEDYALKAVKYSERTLMAGFTTVRDLGGIVAISLRNAINQGDIKGPRILAAGKSIATTGGHADPSNGYSRALVGDPEAKDGVINSPEEARKAVRQRYKESSDVIKITATGGVLSNAKDGAGAQFTEDEIKAVVSTAKDYGYRVAAHAHGAEGMKRAIRAGVSSIEHGTFMDDEVIALMKENGTYYVPTITAGKSVADSAKIPGYYPPLVVPKAIATGPKIQSTFAKAYKAGVKIAFGTDAGVFAHGKNYKEFEYMVEAGMPAMEAIKSATMNAADLLGISDRIGSIEKGKSADIIAVNGDPIKDIKVLSSMSFVMKEGVVYK